MKRKDKSCETDKRLQFLQIIKKQYELKTCKSEKVAQKLNTFVRQPCLIFCTVYIMCRTHIERDCIVAVSFFKLCVPYIIASGLVCRRAGNSVEKVTIGVTIGS